MVCRRFKKAVIIGRRAKKAGIRTRMGCHRFHGTGMIIRLPNAGEPDIGQRMTGHVSPRTTKPCDRRADSMTLDELTRLVFEA
jgi:hypothetical protein